MRSGIENWIPLFVIVHIIAGLWLEATGARLGWQWAEAAVGVLTCLHLSAYLIWPRLLGSLQVKRPILLVCLVLATTGELMLSAVWGLYHYRNSVLPLFVPPGHVLLLLSGLALARTKMIPRGLIWLGMSISLIVLGAHVLRGSDHFSLVLLGVFCLCAWRGGERGLYPIMFLMSWGLEMLGTHLQVWTWQPTVPWIELSAANPPLAAGAFYALLDVLCIRLAKLWEKPDSGEAPEGLLEPGTSQAAIMPDKAV